MGTLSGFLVGSGASRLLVGIFAATVASSLLGACFSERSSPVGSVTHAANALCKGAALLPDLVAEVPTELRIRRSVAPPGHGASPRFLLVFRTSVHNDGHGPLRIVGQRASRAQTELGVR